VQSFLAKSLPGPTYENVEWNAQSVRPGQTHVRFEIPSFEPMSVLILAPLPCSVGLSFKLFEAAWRHGALLAPLPRPTQWPRTGRLIVLYPLNLSSLSRGCFCWFLRHRLPIPRGSMVSGLRGDRSPSLLPLTLCHPAAQRAVTYSYHTSPHPLPGIHLQLFPFLGFSSTQFSSLFHRSPPEPYCKPVPFPDKLLRLVSLRARNRGSWRRQSFSRIFVTTADPFFFLLMFPADLLSLPSPITVLVILEYIPTPVCLFPAGLGVVFFCFGQIFI